MKKHWQEFGGVTILCVFVAWTTFFSPVDYSGFDPLGNLLTSQAILQQHTIKLDQYQKELHGYVTGWHLRKKQEHIYYHYPLGTPFIALPFVGIANIFHLDMSVREHDALLQNILSTLSTTFVTLLCYLIFRYYLPFQSSLLLTAAFVFGSSIVSTMGTALWSVNFSSVFVFSSLNLVIYEKALRRFRLYPYILGICLFFAYLCRPTALIFIGLIIIYAWLKQREILRALLGMVCVCLLLFMAFSWSEYRQILPDYYLPQQLGESSLDVWTAVSGHLVSPSRGIFIYSPHLALLLLGSVIFLRQLFRNIFFLGAVLWIGLHLLLISRNSMWWGGGCFGGRMFTDALPAFVMLTAPIWNYILTKRSAAFRRVFIGLFLLCAGAGIYINTHQGLYNTYTLDWGDSHLFDWTCPQFLASHSCLALREFQTQEARLELYTVGEDIYPDSKTAIFSSWYWVEGSGSEKFRWSRGPIASIHFASTALERNSNCVLEIRLGSYRRQQIHMTFNGKNIGGLELDDSQPVDYTFTLPGDLVRHAPNGYNVLTFELGNALQPADFIGKGWVRAIAVSIWKVRLVPSSNDHLF